MNIQFLGAAREVTGSCCLVEVNGKNILVDSGMEQGRDVFQNVELPVNPNKIDFVLLTHAHIDHSGNLPLLVSKGFYGDIYATEATCELCEIMLKDSAHIQEFDAQWINRKAKRSGHSEVKPSYSMEDALACISMLKPLAYNKEYELAPGIVARYTDVGHLLGSASITLTLSENDITKTLVFSGDIGNLHQPILKDPSYLSKADYVVMESTYGNRNHGEKPDYIADLSSVLQETFARGGNVVIPSFAVGRTQELLYFFREIKEKKLVSTHPDFEVYVDSPLAVEATQIFKESALEYFDAEMVRLLKQGINPITFEGLKMSITSEDSKHINFDTTPKVIISASGMCNAGRIRHHLKHNLWRPECTVLFVGYQAEGTLGRQLYEGTEFVKLFGETVEVRAQIRTLRAVSGHADKDGLTRWASAFDPKPQHYFICHGEEAVSEQFAGFLADRFSVPCTAPYNGEKWDLLSGKQLLEGNKEYIKQQQRKRYSELYENLLSAEKRLHEIIANSEGLANELLRKFTKQIDKLTEYWKE